MRRQGRRFSLPLLRAAGLCGSVIPLLGLCFLAPVVAGRGLNLRGLPVAGFFILATLTAATCPLLFFCCMTFLPRRNERGWSVYFGVALFFCFVVALWLVVVGWAALLARRSRAAGRP